MQVMLTGFAAIGYFNFCRGCLQIATVTHLATRLSVKWGTTKNHCNLCIHSSCRNFFASGIERDHIGAVFKTVIADKFGAACNTNTVTVIQSKLTGRTSAGALGFHTFFIAVHIHAVATLSGYIIGQVGGETKGVIELKNQLAWQLLSTEFFQGRVQHAHSLIQGAGKLLFFFFDRGDDFGLHTQQFGIGFTHHFTKSHYQLVEEAAFGSEIVSMAQCPTDNPAQYIAATFIGGHNTINHQKGTGANMVGNHF